MMRYATTFHLLLLAMITSPTSAEDATAPFVVPGNAQSVFTSRCLDCHSGADAKGSVRFDNLAQIGNEARLKLLNKAQSQLFFELMPPADAEQPTSSERITLGGWIRSELLKHNA
ncbi:MAG: c-type cytochrome domain-containing protein, partial [Planctomycetota bacterium]|nr:c-type cytochrome domain-containing protein [Planctomycetota bacterium]